MIHTPLTVKAARELLQQKTPHMLLFTAPWCGPCKTLKPALKTWAEEAKVDLLILDVDLLPTLARQFRVSAMPTMVWRRPGKRNRRQVGLTDLPLKKQIQKLAL